MTDNKDDKGFTVVDRRIGSDGEAAPEAPAPPCGAEGCAEAAAADAREAYRERGEEDIPITFPGFLLSLHTSALIHLGVIPDPVGRKKVQDLGLARQNIGLLEMLQDKTEGRRTVEETGLLENILYELRLAYVEISKQPAAKGDGK